jgi:predicted RecB family nuclease
VDFTDDVAELKCPAVVHSAVKSSNRSASETLQMKKDSNTRILYSPSDLVTYLESPFASWMQRMYVEGVEGIERDEESADLKLIQEHGNVHEARHLEKLRADGCDVVEIAQFGENAAAQTAAAIGSRREVVFQARLSMEDFSGMADFIVLGESDDSGESGERRYEVQDTKLASSAKPYHLVQLCCYAEMLESITGYLPEKVAVILGSGDVKRFRTEDFYHYYLRVKHGFLELMAGFAPDAEPPVPAPRADHGRWQSYADKWLDARDHLVRVAGITAGQIKKLDAAGITTLEELVGTEVLSVPKLNGDTFTNLKRQAHAQWMTRQRQKEAEEGVEVMPWYEVLPPPAWEPERGLGMLPPASPLDVFFDIEGYPLVEGGLEYLLGATYIEGGEVNFTDWWAHDPAEEKVSFEQFIDWAFARWQLDPSMHIYHYAAYEITALRKLMGRYATREEQVDTLLHRGVFVDLYRVVRQGILFGDDSYSIKRVEKLYFEGRKADVKDAASSIVFYAEWMGSGESTRWKESPLLKTIRDYNEEDCVSTWKLADWLRLRQSESGIAYSCPAALREQQDAPAELQPVNENEARRQVLASKMLEDVATAEARGDSDPQWRIQELLAYLLNFYRREEKPVWWAMFDRLEQTVDALIEDMNCLGGIERTDRAPFAIKKSQGVEYSFDPNQDTKIREGKTVIVRENREIRATVDSFDQEGLIVLKLGPTALKLLAVEPLPNVISLIPDEFVSAEGLKQSIERLVEKWSNTRRLPPALNKLFLREGPCSGNAVRQRDETPMEASLRMVHAMDGATLVVQGPPGTGKTYTASHMIAALLRDGKNVGVVSNSHKAILNLLRATAGTVGSDFRGIRGGGEHDEELAAQAPNLDQVKDNKKCTEKYRGGLIAGTAWLFAREEMINQLDYLFIDEAGQVSLAHVTAMAASTRNLVLLGDQMQLGQPVQGSHPGDSGRSTLDYLLDVHAVVPPHLGIFLDETRRMHPDICEFISNAVYEGRLRAHASTARRVIRANGATLVPVEKGILYAPVVHDGNTQASDEEIDCIVEITNALLGREHINSEGQSAGRLSIEDVLFVAPYNMQVRCLRDRLPAGARVGSVDKFQGQEAPVVILSLCASAGEYGSRGLKFILDRNRLNVAISRAQSLAIVVAEPRIAETAVTSVEDMERVNLFCKILGLQVSA